METKPFSLQSPEQIAKDYGGNKQKIAEAMQMGILDPTAGTLAGMFIDRMRSAAQMEGAPQQTVAQQVFAPPQPQMPQGLGQMPMGAPPAPMAPAGLGATPEAAAMPAPEMPAPEMPMPGMAMGGLTALHVPDDMFDEPSNGSYAGGGLVAFSDGGGVDTSNPAAMGAYIEQMARKTFPNIQIAGRGRTAARNAEVDGVANSYHLIDAARDISVPPGMTKAEFITQMKGVFGSNFDVLPSKGNSIHIEPGPALGKQVRAGAPAKTGLPTDLSALAGVNLADQFDTAYAEGEKFYDTKMPAPKREAQSRLLNYIAEQGGEEALKKQAKEDKWSALAEFGFRMASSNSPYFLQAVGEAASATLPGTKEAKKAREERKLRSLQAYADAEGIDNQAAQGRIKFAMDFATTKLGYKEKDLTRATNIASTMFEADAETERTRMEQEGAITRANINAAEANAPGNTGNSSAQWVTLSGQFKSRMEEAYKAMKTAEGAKNYGAFQRAAAAHREARKGYNLAASALGVPGMLEVSMAEFPKMNEEFKKRNPRTSTPTAKGDAGKPPAGVTQAEWNVMSPEDRAYFQ